MLDVNYMKRNAKEAADVVTRDVTQFRCFFKQELQDAVMARFNLDKLLLTERQLMTKWSRQCLVRKNVNLVVFRGIEDECINYINREENQDLPLEIYWPLPDELHWDWDEYFKNVENRSGIEMDI